MFVYTREAHPGESAPAHRTMDDKMAMARRFVERWGVERRMLVDALDGPLHRAYGTLPNMSYLVRRGGRLAFKSNWTDASTIRVALEQMLVEQATAAAGQRLTPYTVEWQAMRANDLEAFMSGLLDAGPRAVVEFIDAYRHSYGDKIARPLQEWWDAHRSD